VTDTERGKKEELVGVDFPSGEWNGTTKPLYKNQRASGVTSDSNSEGKPACGEWGQLGKIQCCATTKVYPAGRGKRGKGDLQGLRTSERRKGGGTRQNLNRL